jgi:hypothetical protein
MAGKSTATANNCRCYGSVYQAQQNNVLASCVLNTSNAYSATQETNENETFKLETNENNDFHISTGDKKYGLLKAIRSLRRAPFCVS